MKLEVKVAYAVLKDRLELSLSKGLIDEDGGILLEIVVKEALPSTLELPDQITELKVELSNGAKFVLFDVFRSKGVSSSISSRTSVFSFGAKYYVSGFRDLKKFQK